MTVGQPPTLSEPQLLHKQGKSSVDYTGLWGARAALGKSELLLLATKRNDFRFNAQPQIESFRKLVSLHAHPFEVRISCFNNLCDLASPIRSHFKPFWREAEIKPTARSVQGICRVAVRVQQLPAAWKPGLLLGLSANSAAQGCSLGQGHAAQALTLSSHPQVASRRLGQPEASSRNITVNPALQSATEPKAVFCWLQNS